MGRKKGGIPGLSFSWKRALGISSAKAKLAKQIGVPLTKSGRRQKFGKGAGCCVPFLVLSAGLAGATYGFTRLVF